LFHLPLISDKIAGAGRKEYTAFLLPLPKKFAKMRPYPGRRSRLVLPASCMISKSKLSSISGGGAAGNNIPCKS